MFGITFRKKYTMAWASFIVGTVLVFQSPTALLTWTGFCGTLLAVFSTADVFDKKFNGGEYNAKTDE